MRYLILFLLFIFCLIGCGPQPKGFFYVHNPGVTHGKTIPIWIDKNFSTQDKIRLDDAVKQWNYVLNGQIVLNVVDTQFDMEISKLQAFEDQGGWLFMKIDHTNHFIPANDTGFTTLAFADQIGGHSMYMVRDVMTDDMVLGVTLHEIGHLLGAKHDNSGLMFPHYSKDGFQCVDKMAMEEVAEFFHLDDTKMNYCKRI